MPNNNKLCKNVVSYLFLTILFLTAFVSITQYSYAETIKSSSEMDRDAFKSKQEEKDKNLMEKLKERFTQRKEKQQEQRDLRKENIENKCNMAKNRIDNKIKMFNTSEKFHQTKYKGLIEKLEKLATRLESEDVDTGDLKEDTETLKGKVQILDQKFSALISKLEDMKNQACQNEDKTSKLSLDDARSLLTDVRNAEKDVREFFANEIKPDLDDIRAEIKSKKEDNNQKEEN